MSTTLVVVGSQWGDEGKGKITDYFASHADMVVRYQGGNNAGHSVAFGGKKYSLQSIPSGIFNPQTINVMGNGMVVNPVSVIAELKKLSDQGITEHNLYISTRAAMVMPWHSALDGAYEANLGKALIGTTKKGIGPCYADKYSRIGMRIGDLLEPEYFRMRLEAALAVKNPEMKMLGLPEMDADEIYNQYMEIAEQLKDRIVDTSDLINKHLQGEGNILFEGAQGMMLCIDHGTYPYVTSSTPSAASVPVGAGIAPQWIKTVAGVLKAYCTRVGEGPFPTELHDEIGDGIRERGHEYGTVTGRPRRVGWLDCCVAKYTSRLSGITNWAVTLLDVLSGIDTLRICYAYELDGKVIECPPSTIAALERCKPLYVEMPGWKEDITAVRNYEDLPENARKYLEKVEEITGVPVGLVSVGPDREQTFITSPELKKFAK